ncbi:MAG: tyrosine-type recombinase/integrase [Muriicola sp.]|nr:tyrosine-type recombinase/integrase [Muriicola sp.]
MAVDAFIAYLSHERNYSPHTLKAYRKDLEDCTSFLQISNEESSLEEATYGEIRNWIVYMVEDGLSNRSVNRKITSLKSYYKFLFKVGVLKSNPLTGHKALKTSKKMEIPFSQAEMSTLFTELPFEDNFEGIRDRLIIELFYATGIRRAELINLRLADLDLTNRSIKVLGKRNKERIIPLLMSTKTLFEAYLNERQQLNHSEESEYLFLTAKGNKVYETLVYRIINGYFREVSSKVKRSPHILRHTFATHMLNQGADLNSVKELLGHSSLASTQVYTHNSIAELKKVHSRAHPRNKKEL